MSASSSSYNATVALDRKLTTEETNELKIIMLPYFHATPTNTTEDIGDLIDYALAMVNNQKSIEYITTELIGMEMEFCTSAVADKVGNALSEFIQKILGGGGGGDGDVTASASAAAPEEEEEAGGESKKNPKIASLKVSKKKKGHVYWI
jgi:hypothetical protein